MSSGKENPEVLDIPEVKVAPETGTGTVILKKANLDSEKNRGLSYFFSSFTRTGFFKQSFLPMFVSVSSLLHL
jgi:hypothetical protein